MVPKDRLNITIETKTPDRGLVMPLTVMGPGTPERTKHY